MTVGRIHSIETLGLVDGPGIRVVVFMQGCLLRCAYCHNPDTWNKNGGTEITAEELLNKVKRYKGFFKSSGGGVTLSGGDPLIQSEFVAEFFKMCKEEGINTALDTSGFGHGDYDEVLKYTDLVLLDIKHIDDNNHKQITGRGREEFLKFLSAVERNNNKIWIRHVVVPGLTDSEDNIRKLGKYINTISNVEKVQLLPYHTQGIDKYRDLNIPYKLEGVPALEREKLDKLYLVLDEAMEKLPRTRRIAASKSLNEVG